MSNVSLERYYFVLYDGALTLKMSKWCLTRFAIKLFIYSSFFPLQILYINKNFILKIRWVSC